jgi:alanyl-tRNA synthetase
VEDRLVIKERFCNETIEIIDTKKRNNLILHFAKQLPENINAGFVAKVNQDQSNCRNHSADASALKYFWNSRRTKGSLVNQTICVLTFRI